MCIFFEYKFGSKNFFYRLFYDATRTFTDFGKRVTLAEYQALAKEGCELVAEAVRDARVTAGEIQARYNELKKRQFVGKPFSVFAQGFRTWLIKVDYTYFFS